MTADSITFILGDEPAGSAGRQTTYPYAYPCGCNLDTGYCDPHRFMIAEIHDAYYNGGPDLATAIYALSDGYGETGLVPPQGYDWSGIRDSSPAAIEAMWKVVHA